MRFEVEDTGVGIPMDQQAAVFLPFQQGANSQQQAEGTGLGLAISKRLVELMGGQLCLESVVGQGSLFWFEVPLVEVINQSDVRKIHRPPIIGFHGKTRKILVVDDKWENRIILLNVLRPLGFVVLEAEDGQTALQLMPFYLPEVVITDLVMPVMDGFELAKQIRRSSQFNDVIIIATSASAFEHHRQQSLQSGCQMFIPKPVRVDELLETLQQFLKLDWIYEESVVNVPRQVVEALTEETVAGPNAAQAQALFELAMTGNVRKIIESVNQLEQQDASLTPFASKIRQLAKSFKMSKLQTFVKQYLTTN
jgi:CheY-like chemotaxis protein